MSKRDIERINSKETVRYLEDLFKPNTLLSNPTPLVIPGIGKVTATSQKLTRYDDEIFERYFCFTKGKKTGEVIFRENNYLIKYETKANQIKK